MHPGHHTINDFDACRLSEMDIRNSEKKNEEIADIVSRFFDCAVRSIAAHESFSSGDVPARLDKAIEDTLQIASEQPGRMPSVAKGISLGILRARKLPEREIRSSLESTARILVSKAIGIGADLEGTVEGFIEGISTGAGECGLDASSCAASAARGAVMAGYERTGDTGDIILDLLLRWMSDTGMILPKNASYAARQKAA